MNFMKQWDKVSIYLLLMAFGAYSTGYPIISFERVAPHWAEIMLGVEFFVAGLFLLLGLGKRKGFRLAGLWVIAIGLSTISLSIGIVGGTRVLAYSFLFGAFAMQSVHDIRAEKQDKKLRKEEAVQLTHELIELADGIRQGDER